MSVDRSWAAALVALVAAAVSTPGCARGPVAGHWNATNSDGYTSVTVELDLDGDGSMRETLTGTGNCTGSLVRAGGEWAVTDTVLTTLSGPSCSGSLTCTIAGELIPVECAMVPSSGTSGSEGMYDYTLTNGEHTLTLTSTGSGGATEVFTRGS